MVTVNDRYRVGAAGCLSGPHATACPWSSTHIQPRVRTTDRMRKQLPQDALPLAIEHAKTTSATTAPFSIQCTARSLALPLINAMVAVPLNTHASCPPSARGILESSTSRPSSPRVRAECRTCPCAREEQCHSARPRRPKGSKDNGRHAPQTSRAVATTGWVPERALTALSSIALPQQHCRPWIMPTRW